MHAYVYRFGELPAPQLAVFHAPSTAVWIGIPPSSSAMPPMPVGRLPLPVDDDLRVSPGQETQSLGELTDDYLDNPASIEHTR